MATVYLARDRKHHRQVAIKVLKPELAAALGPQRFLREIEIAARLNHPHILALHDSGDADGFLYFVMPYVEGESLRQRLVREKQLPLEDALQITDAVASALGYAHRHDVIHRDIKPENILLSGGEAVVADFGIARAITAAGGNKVTTTGVAVGTPTYMSPEQAAGDAQLDGRSDIYSLGCVLYEMLAGESPFMGPTPQAIRARALTETPRRIHRIRGGVPEVLDAVIAKAIAVTPADRYNSATEFASALELPIREMRTLTALGHSALSRFTRHRSLVAVPIVVVLLGLGMFIEWRGSHGGREAVAPKRLAVLPFENLGAPEDDYFADGITDEVRGKLTALKGLDVIASASSTQYRRTSKTPDQIGRELKVRYLLVGKVRWAKRAGSPSRVEVSPELIDVASGVDQWQQPFDADLRDVFEVQVDIATRVAGALGVALGTRAREVLAGRPTRNLAAYDAFLRGKAVSALSNVDPTTTRKALAYFEQAVALDSNFAEAWGELARTHALLYGVSAPTAGDADAARSAAERSLALAPNDPEGHVALALYYSEVTSDMPRAYVEASRALELAPGSARLLSMVAYTEQGLARSEAAQAHFEQALRLDPLSVVAIRLLAHTLLRTRQYSEAREVCDRGLTLAPKNLQLLRLRAMAALGAGDLAAARAGLATAPNEIDTGLVVEMASAQDLMWALDDGHQTLLLRLRPRAFDEDRATWAIDLAQTYALRSDLGRARIYADSARVSLEEELRGAPDNETLHAMLGLAFAYLGEKAEAIREGERGVTLTPITKNAFSGSYVQHLLVRIYLLVGEPEKALDQLESLLKFPYYLSPAWLKIDPNFDALRRNPRFQRLMARR
jgi:eukaryotic-like serine/threonine-protein kinase